MGLLIIWKRPDLNLRERGRYSRQKSEPSKSEEGDFRKVWLCFYFYPIALHLRCLWEYSKRLNKLVSVLYYWGKTEILEKWHYPGHVQYNFRFINTWINNFFLKDQSRYKSDTTDYFVGISIISRKNDGMIEFFKI